MKCVFNRNGWCDSNETNLRWWLALCNEIPGLRAEHSIILFIMVLLLSLHLKLGHYYGSCWPFRIITASFDVINRLIICDLMDHLRLMERKLRLSQVTLFIGTLCMYTLVFIPKECEFQRDRYGCSPEKFLSHHHQWSFIKRSGFWQSIVLFN